MLRSLLVLSILCLFVIYSFNFSSTCKWDMLRLFRSQSLVNTLFFLFCRERSRKQQLQPKVIVIRLLQVSTPLHSTVSQQD